MYWRRGKYSDEECAKLTEKLRKHKLSRWNMKLFNAINDLGEEGYTKAKDVIASYLNDGDPQIRNISLVILAILWGYKAYYPVAKNFLLNDPEEENKMAGATAIGKLFRGTHNKEVIKILLPFFLDKTRSSIFREAIYGAILDVLGIPIQHHPSFNDDGELERKVDWNFIRDIKLGKIPKKGHKCTINKNFKILIHNRF